MILGTRASSVRLSRFVANGLTKTKTYRRDAASVSVDVQQGPKSAVSGSLDSQSWYGSWFGRVISSSSANATMSVASAGPLIGITMMSAGHLNS